MPFYKHYLKLNNQNEKKYRKYIVKNTKKFTKNKYEVKTESEGMHLIQTSFIDIICPILEYVDLCTTLNAATNMFEISEYKLLFFNQFKHKGPEH